MIPKPFTVYSMKKFHSYSLHGGPVKRCVVKCGNRFRYLVNNKDHANMECMRCGYKYYTDICTFFDRYEEDTSGLKVTNPNLLFRQKELL